MHGLLTSTRVIAPTEAVSTAPVIVMTPRPGRYISIILTIVQLNTALGMAQTRPAQHTADPAWLSAPHSPGALEYVPAPHAMQLAELGAPAAECLSAIMQRVCCSPDTCTTRPMHVTLI